VFIIVFDLYLPFFDSMFGVKRAKKCISDLLASHMDPYIHLENR
jgi:hypothetical protein